MLVDTGSSGVRIFRSVLTVPLQAVPTPTGTLAECLQFGDGSSDWGTVDMADVILAEEPAVRVPVHVIDASYASPPAECANADASPVAAGFAGILGVGLFVEDCGPACSASASNRMYFSCGASGCAGTATPLALQVSNPVAFLPGDNNGVVIQLPTLSAGGAPSADGSLVLGVGTQANNVPSGAMTYGTDAVGDLTTISGGADYSGFIDTGSNGLFFPPPAGATLPICPSPDSQWYCPASRTNLSATNVGAAGSPSAVVPFTIDDLSTLLGSSNNVSAEIGGPATPTQGFDWGLPFHFGRRVFYGIEGRPSPLGTGPYDAY
jgi:hypothetical protein